MLDLRPAECDQKCPRFSEAVPSPFIWGSGPESTSLMIVGRDPGQNENRTGRVFVGKAGQLLNDLLLELGTDRTEVYVTNAVKCGKVGEDKEPGKKETDCCRKHLLREISQVNPNVIVAFGNTAMQALLNRTGVMRLQNNVVWSEIAEKPIKVVPVLHPAYALRNPEELHRIREGLQLAIQEAQSSKLVASKKDTVHLVADTPDKVKKCLRKLLQVPAFSLDIETDRLNFVGGSQILCIQFSWKPRLGVVIPWELVSGEIEVLLREVLGTPAVKIGHNLKFDVQHLLAHGYRVKGPFFDTIVAHSLIDDNSPDHALDALVLRYTDMGEYWSDLYEFKAGYCASHGMSDKEFSYSLVPPKILYPYACSDADATFRIYETCKDRLREEDQEEFFSSFSMPFLPVLLEMEYRGIRIDREKLLALRDEYEKKRDDFDREIATDPNIIGYTEYRRRKQLEKLRSEYEDNWNDKPTLRKRFPAVLDYIQHREKTRKTDKGLEFNMNSTLQLRELFFTFMNLEVIKRTKKGNQPCTDKEVLQILAEDMGVNVAVLLDKRRKVNYFINSFLIPSYEKSAIDGRIHTSYIQHDVITGRLCVSGDTMIETSTGPQRIDEVSVGTMVLTHQGRYRKVLRRYIKGLERMFEVTCGGETIKCTLGHRFLTPDGWKCLRETKEGTFISMVGVGVFIEPHELVYKKESIDSIVECGVLEVWDIEVEEDHSYVAAGFINHNSSRNPNLQNLPRDAKDYRSCFLSDPDYVFVKADLAQAEFRVWAAVSGDEDMIADIESGLDIHRRTASEVFRVSPEDVDDAQRTAAKRGVFGMMYGIGPKTLAQRFKITIEQAEGITDVFASRYPIATNWIKSQPKVAHAQKWVQSWMGRKRRLPHIDSDDRNMVAKAERQAMNGPIQAAASDMNNAYMVTTVREARKRKIDCYPAMTTHDENVIQVREGQEHTLVALMRKIPKMTFPDFRCEMKFDFKVGTTIGTAVEYDDEG